MKNEWYTDTPFLDGTYLVTIEDPVTGNRVTDTLIFSNGEWLIDKYKVVAWQFLPEEYDDGTN